MAGRYRRKNNRLWCVVLAGGEGERLRPLTERWLGRHVPKQYCTFVGTRSMFRHTLDRAAQISPRHQIVTVIARDHQTVAGADAATRSGTIVLQPANRDTAPGLFLALSYVRAVDPEATVAILPSDHFIHPEEKLFRTLDDAVLVAETLERVVLVGVTPQRVELEYGWIQPGRSLRGTGSIAASAVELFLEKPHHERAEAARRAGGLWNTMVTVARVNQLWSLGRLYLPDVVAKFDRFTPTIGTPAEGATLNALYEFMPKRNFSADLLEKASEELAVVELQDTTWSDWGSAARIEETIRQLGKVPAFAAVSRFAAPEYLEQKTA